MTREEKLRNSIRRGITGLKKKQIIEMFARSIERLDPNYDTSYYFNHFDSLRDELRELR